jgi:hypothetical protein
MSSHNTNQGNAANEVARLRNLLADPFLRIPASSLSKIQHLGQFCLTLVPVIWVSIKCHHFSLKQFDLTTSNLLIGEGGFATVESCWLINSAGQRNKVAVKRFRPEILRVSA